MLFLSMLYARVESIHREFVARGMAYTHKRCSMDKAIVHSESRNTVEVEFG